MGICPSIPSDSDLKFEFAFFRLSPWPTLEFGLTDRQAGREEDDELYT